MPPRFLSASVTGRITSWPGVSCAAAAISPMVRPSTVAQPSWSRPSSCRLAPSTANPPAPRLARRDSTLEGLVEPSQAIRPLRRLVDGAHHLHASGIADQVEVLVEVGKPLSLLLVTAPSLSFHHRSPLEPSPGTHATVWRD